MLGFICSICGLLIMIVGFIIGGIDTYERCWKLNYKQFIIALVGAIFIGLGCINKVPTGHTGIVTTFGKVEDVTLEAGIHILFPWNTVTSMDNRTQKATLQLECVSSDIQEVNMAYTLNYQIKKTNAQEIYKTIGVNYYKIVVMPRIQESVKTMTAKYTAENLIASRNELGRLIEKDLAFQLEKYNIELVGTSIENMSFTEAFTQAVEEKQVAEQNKLKSSIQKEQAVIEAEAKAETKVIEAKAEAEANELLEKSLSEKILQQMFIEKWDGELPKVTGGEGNIMDITSLIESDTVHGKE